MEGGIIAYERLSFPVNISFNNFCQTVAIHIGTRPEDLSIGYRLRYNLNVRSQARASIYKDLANEATFRGVMDTMVQKLSKARTRSIILEIYNKVSMFAVSPKLAQNSV